MERQKPFPSAGLELRAGPGVVLGRQAWCGHWGRGQHLKWAGGGAWPRVRVLRSPWLWLTALVFGTWGLVEGPPAVLRAAETRDLDVLNGELVVIRDLLVDIDVLL